MSLASCQRDEVGNTNVDQTELPPFIGNKDGTVAASPKPEIIEFDGFVDYGSPIEVQPSENLVALPEGVIITESRIEMPVFTREPAGIKEAQIQE